jgi:hypothetical protein
MNLATTSTQDLINAAALWRERSNDWIAQGRSTAVEIGNGLASRAAELEAEIGRRVVSGALELCRGN